MPIRRQLGAVPDYARLSFPGLVYAEFPLTVVLPADLYPGIITVFSLGQGNRPKGEQSCPFM